MVTLEDKIASLIKANRYILLEGNCRRVAKEIMAEVYSSGFKQIIFPFQDTCGEAPEKVTGIPHDKVSEEPIIFGEDTGDMAYQPRSSYECRSLHLYQTWMAKQERATDTAELIGAYQSEYDHAQPCHDVDSTPHCSKCPHNPTSDSVCTDYYSNLEEGRFKK